MLFILTKFSYQQSSYLLVHVFGSRACLHFEFVGDKLIAFNVDSKAFPQGWFKGPSDAKLYIDRGQDFLQRLYAGEYEKA